MFLAADITGVVVRTEQLLPTHVNRPALANPGKHNIETNTTTDSKNSFILHSSLLSLEPW